MAYHRQRGGAPPGPVPGSGDQAGSRARPVVPAGIIGLVALGGVVAGLVAPNGSTPDAGALALPVRDIPAGQASVSQALGARHLLGAVSGTGAGHSRSFVVPSGTVVAHYSYACPGGTGTSKFGAALVNSSGSDIAIIAGLRGTAGSQWTTVHPRNAGASYHIAVSSRCPYRVQVYSR